MSTIRKVRYRGDCMEGRGLPPRGTAVYDEQLQPRVLDLVICEHPLGALNLCLKEVVRTGAKPIVHTCYADGKKDFATLSPKTRFDSGTPPPPVWLAMQTAKRSSRAAARSAVLPRREQPITPARAASRSGSRSA